MKNKVNILVLAGLTDKKLSSKLLPLINLDNVKQIYLVRKVPLKIPKVESYYPPQLVKKVLPLVELYRVVSAVYILLTKKVDLILGFHYKMHTIYAFFLSKLFKIKFGFLITENPELYEGDYLFSKVANSASFVSVRGSHSQEYLTSKGIPKEKIVILHNVFDLPKKVTRHKEKTYDLIFIGNFVKDKRPDIAVETVRVLKRTLPAVKMVMVGKGLLKQKIVKLSHQYHLENNVEFINYTHNIEDYLAKSRVLLMTSQSEGLPMVIIEAMAQGLPCIVSGVGDTRDIAIDGHNSLVINTLDSNDFANKARILLLDNNLYKRLSAGAYEIKDLVEHEYSLKKIQADWSSLLKEISS